MSIFLHDKQRQLELLKEEANACFKCSHLGAMTDKKVFGEGYPDKYLMSISEAPGRFEWEFERPYQGIAGQFWEGMLSSVGWDRSQFYVCNAVCCRPMYSGKSNCLSPNLEEVYSCQNFLLKQVAIVQPKVLLVFGKVAALSLGILDKVTYSKPLKPMLGIQKKPYFYLDFEGREQKATVALFYHPSYLMSKPDGKAFCYQTYIHLHDAKKLFEADLL